MKKNIKTIIGLIIVFIIGISTTVGAAAIFRSEDITYSSDKTDKTNVKDSLDELYSKVGKCPNGYGCFKLTGLAAKVKLGDYISMTPTSKSYTPPSELTGCMNDSNCTQNTIDPSELNLWRVIKKNEDGTVEVVSEYVSSKKVWFYGKTGYISYIKALNTIAAQYTDGVHVEKTRHIGYSNQTEYITDTSKIDQTTAPWAKSTEGSWTATSSGFTETEEAQGAGDVGYTTDYDLVNGVYGTMVANNPSGSSMPYWLASHFYDYGSRVDWSFDNRKVHETGITYGTNLYTHGSAGMHEEAKSNAIRPVLTLKSDIEIKNGDGKSAATSYTFE